MQNLLGLKTYFLRFLGMQTGTHFGFFAVGVVVVVNTTQELLIAVCKLCLGVFLLPNFVLVNSTYISLMWPINTMLQT